MNDIITDFRESAKIDVNDVLNDMQKDIQMIGDDLQDLKNQLIYLKQCEADHHKMITQLINELGALKKIKKGKE